MRILKYNVRTVLLCVSIVLATKTVFSQVSITAALLPGNLYLRSQLWNVNISNVGNQRGVAVLKLELKDLQSHQTVLTAVTNHFDLPGGGGMLQQQALEPVVWNSFIPGSSSFLPVGQYDICYQLSYSLGGSETSFTAEDCEQVMVEPLTPPILVLPENDSVVVANTPNFSWMPPSPTAMFSNLNYDIQISELYDGQSPTDAIQNNLPLQLATNLEQPSFFFPLSGPQLEQGKNYVWQVIARDGARMAARSETWIFRRDSVNTTPKFASAVFLQMDEGNSNLPGLADSGVLRIKYVSYLPTHLAPILIKDVNENILSSGKREIRQGDNYLEFPLGRRYHSGDIYTILFIDTDQKQHSLKFTCR